MDHVTQSEIAARKRDYLEALRRGASVGEAVRSIGYTRRGVSGWRQKDAAFRREEELIRGCSSAELLPQRAADPSPDEIAARSHAIQSAWSDRVLCVLCGFADR